MDKTTMGWGMNHQTTLVRSHKTAKKTKGNSPSMPRRGLRVYVFDLEVLCTMFPRPSLYAAFHMSAS